MAASSSQDTLQGELMGRHGGRCLDRTSRRRGGSSALEIPEAGISFRASGV